jgi:hypothetical protein
MLWSAGREFDGEAPVEERCGSRSATAPPISKNAIIVTRDDVATYPMSGGDPPMASTANGSATEDMAEPAHEITSQAGSSRKLRAWLSPRGVIAVQVKATSAAFPPSLPDGQGRL